MGYGTEPAKDGYALMRWGDFNARIKYRLVRTLRTSKDRAEQKGIPHDIDIDYLLSIYPKDNKCPILGTEFEFGADKIRTRPSLDRIIPNKGYAKGNVVFISNLANTIKTSANSEEILKVGKWLKKYEKWGKLE